MWSGTRSETDHNLHARPERGDEAGRRGAGLRRGVDQGSGETTRGNEGRRGTTTGEGWRNKRKRKEERKTIFDREGAEKQLEVKKGVEKTRGEGWRNKKR